VQIPVGKRALVSALRGLDEEAATVGSEDAERDLRPLQFVPRPELP
jgi:hypothetical protein